MDSKMITLEQKANEDGTYTIVTQHEEKLSKIELHQRLIQKEAHKIDCVNQMLAIKARYEKLSEEIKNIKDMVGEQPQELPSIPE